LQSAARRSRNILQPTFLAGLLLSSFVSTESTAEKHSHDDNDGDDDDDDDRGCHSQFNNQPNTNSQRNQLGSPK